MRSHAEIPTPLCLTDQFQYIFHLILGSSLIPRELRLYMRFRQLGLLLLTLFMIGFAYRYPMIHVGKDVSYGVYIYHMIFVNIAIALGYTRSWMAFGIVIVVTWAVAYFSTIFVGEYSRRIKERILSAGR